MSCGPQFVGDALWLDAELRPPSHFIAGPMQVAVMGATKRHRVFIADLEAKASRLRKAQVMGVRWLAPANHTGLRGNKLAVALVAPPSRLWRHGIILKFGAVMSREQRLTAGASTDLSVSRRENIRLRDRRWVLPRLGQLPSCPCIERV